VAADVTGEGKRDSAARTERPDAGGKYGGGEDYRHGGGGTAVTGGAPTHRSRAEIGISATLAALGDRAPRSPLTLDQTRSLGIAGPNAYRSRDPPIPTTSHNAGCRCVVFALTDIN